MIALVLLLTSVILRTSTRKRKRMNQSQPWIDVMAIALRTIVNTTELVGRMLIIIVVDE